jgi:purine-binding chemotaxis protein CheW
MNVKTASHASPEIQSIALAPGGGSQWLLFIIDAGRYALPLSVVERVALAVEITPLPGAPAVVLGIVDVAGRVLPVFDLRQRFGLRQRPLRPEDHFLIAATAHRTVVLVIDAAAGLIEGTSHEVVQSERITSGMPHIRGVITREDGLILIHDLDEFLSAAEARTLDDALTRETRHEH